MDSPTSDDDRFRLHEPYLGRFSYHHFGAFLLTLACAALPVVLVAFASPATWLWPAATGGSLQHWIGGIVVGLLCWNVATITFTTLDREARFAATGRAPTGKPTALRTTLLYGFAAMLTWPAWDRIVTAWQINDVQAAVPVALDVAQRLTPVLVLGIGTFAAREWVHEANRRLWHRQHREQDQLDTNAGGLPRNRQQATSE